MKASLPYSLKTTSGSRRAVVTVMVLVVLLLMSALVAQFIRRAVSDRRQTRQELNHVQTVQLATAGVARLRLQRAQDADYVGETWQIPTGVIHQTNAGEVVITVNKDTATVVARYPVNFDLPLQVTKSIRLQ